MAKFVKSFSFVAAVALLVVGVSVSAQTTTFTRDLTIGSTGADVQALQEILIAGNYLVMPAGVSKGYFGQLTANAVKAWQAAKMLPATGYFGPMSRTAIAGSTSGTGTGSTGSTGSLSGGDGDFNDFDVLGNPDTTDVEEGATEEVLAFEFDADDSDLLVERLTLVFSAQTGSTTKPWKVLDEVSVSVDGDEVATVDASDSEEWDEEASDEYSINVSDIDFKAEEGETAKVVVSVTAQDSIDAEDLGEWGIAIAEDGVRALNAEGINVYEGNLTNDEIGQTLSGDERQFELVVVDAGDLDLSFDEDAEGNDDDDVDVDDADETEDVVLYTFTVEAQDAAVTLDEMTVTATSTGSLEDIITELTLEIDGDVVGTESVDGTSTTSVTFEDIDLEIDEDEEVEVVVYATIEATDDATVDGKTVQVTGVTVDYIDGEDDDQTDTELNSTEGGVMTFRESGMNVDSSSISATEVSAPEAASGDKGTYTIKFKVSAGDEDVYVGGVDYSLSGTLTGFSTSSSFTGPSSKLQSNNVNYKVSEGSTVEFTLKTVVTAASTTAEEVIKMALTGIDWNTTNSTTTYSSYTSNLDDYETDELFLSGFGL